MISYPLKLIYRAAGLSRQAVHQSRQRHQLFEHQCTELFVAIDEVLSQHPGCGLEKLYYTLRPEFIGRDRFVGLLQSAGYGCRKQRPRYPKTTIAGNLRFDDLIRGKTFTAPNQVWQSDITYYDLGSRFAYIVFLIDIYSKIIVGHEVSDHLRATANLKALKKAVKRYGSPDIHHSDRGSQYSSHTYLDFLALCKVQVSMAAKGPENAYAERINGIIKNEYLRYWKIENINQLRRKTNKAVNHYNSKRVHRNLSFQTPLQFVKSYPKLSENEKPIVKIPILNS